MDNPYKDLRIKAAEEAILNAKLHRQKVTEQVQFECSHSFIAEQPAGVVYERYRKAMRICLTCGLEEESKFGNADFKVLKGDFVKTIDNVYEYRFPL